MRDFIGNKFEVGDYVAKGGGGNTTGEYGMILARVLETGGKLRMIRLTVCYPGGRATVVSRKFAVKNPNKYVVVRPPQDVADLFERAVRKELTEEDRKTVGRWVHGTHDVFGEGE